jgi:hypothetical protein
MDKVIHCLNISKCFQLLDIICITLFQYYIMLSKFPLIGVLFIISYVDKLLMLTNLLCNIVIHVSCIPAV